MRQTLDLYLINANRNTMCEDNLDMKPISDTNKKLIDA